MTPCPNRFPSIPSNQRLAIISDCPDATDCQAGQPFVSSAGRFLAALLARAGLSRESCFLGHVSQTPLQEFKGSYQHEWASSEIQDGLYQLQTDLAQFKPNCLLLLGPLPLKAFKDPTPGPLKANTFQYKIAKWRGSLITSEDGRAYKCLPAYSPSYCLRDYDAAPLLQFDIKKAVREARSPLLNLPQRTLRTTLTHPEQVAFLNMLREKRVLTALDIEGYIDGMTCISFADSPEHAFVIPINAETPPAVWRALALVLEDHDVPKVLQNSLYDRFVLQYSYGIRVHGVVEDTMLKHWEMYAELEKNLGLQASLYTDEPYYKFERKADEWDVFYKYCCKDSAVTLEICQTLDRQQTSPKDANRTVDELNKIRQHYEMNVALLNPILYMEMVGIKYNVEGAAARRRLLQTKLAECQAKFNALTGFGLDFKSVKGILARRDALMLKKDGSGPYKKYEAAYHQVDLLLKDPNPSLATIGQLEDLLEVGINPGSNKQLIPYLYNELKLPAQHKIVRGAPEGSTPLTADYEALLKLSRWCLQEKKPFHHSIVQAIIEIRSLSTREQMLSISADRDGRIRCGYNIVGTNTGRISCYTSPTGSGYNLQTIPNYQDAEDAPGGVCGDRDLFMADEGCWLFQCDLAGADGWTVAAYCAMLGDKAMLEDYYAGIKPYARIALKIAGLKEAEWNDRQELKAFLKTYKLGDILKLMAKRMQHGGAYLEGGLTISRNILKDSEGKTYVSPIECDKLKNWYIRERYHGIPKWHDWIGRRLRERPVLTAASGQVRQFFGRPDETMTKAVAFEPQANTTYATNLAALQLWSDRDNRQSALIMGMRGDAYGLLDPMSNGRPKQYLKIQPLHQVHDALIGQFKKTDTAWAIDKIKSYFANPLLIAGQTITIPFDGAYGESWGNLNEGKI